MPIRVLLARQAATVTAPPASPSGCPGQGEAIVVCGHAIDPDRYRLPVRDDDRFAPTGPPRAEWGLGGGVRMGVSGQSQAMPQGAISNRAMVTVKIPF